MKFIYQTIILLLILNFGGCVSTHSDRSVANDEDQDIGIGGTGMLATSGQGNGLGGTGIVGIVTGFGSIFVNGIEIEYDTKTPFTINGKETSFQQLNIGDVVEILTTDNKSYTNARTINIRHEVIGKVKSVNKMQHRFNILDQTILLNENTPLPEVGDNIAVAGMRINHSSIQATRVSHAGKQETFLRKNQALPFSEKTNRWVIQTHVRNNTLSIFSNGTLQSMPINKNVNDKFESEGETRILKLKTSNGVIEFSGEIDSLNIPLGSRSPKSSDPSSKHYKPGRLSSPIKMNMPPRMGR